jgi:hypothetical protein
MEFKQILFIRPQLTSKDLVGIDDYLVSGMQALIDKAKNGIIQWDPNKREHYFSERGAYRGFHVTPCGERSSNRNYLIADNIITNSLAPFYLKHYRSSIPEEEMTIVKQLLGIKDSRDIIKYKDFFIK